jgi:hypothetical protein
VTTADKIMEAIEGAVVVCGRVDDGQGLLLDFADGRCLVIAGVFSLELVRFEKDMRH